MGRDSLIGSALNTTISLQTEVLNRCPALWKYPNLGQFDVNSTHSVRPAVSKLQLPEQLARHLLMCFKLEVTHPKKEISVSSLAEITTLDPAGGITSHWTIQPPSFDL